MRNVVLLMSVCLAVSCMPVQQVEAPDPLHGKPIAPFTPGNKTPYVVFGEVYEVMPDSFGYLDIGVASWYGKKFHGRKTSNGEIFDMHQISAAHKSLPIPSMVKVTNLDNGKYVVLRINDRGPFHDNRIIDLSYAAAQKLGFANQGVAPVVVEALDDLNHPERYAAMQAKSNGSSDAGSGTESHVESHVDSTRHTKYYLQLGAFSDVRWAQGLEQQVGDLFEAKGKTVGLKILESELESGVLHKVWLGPLTNEAERSEVAAIVEAAQLGKPINVEVE